MGKRVTGKQILEHAANSGGSRDFEKATFVDLKVDKKNPEVVKKLRIIGLSWEYFEHSNRIPIKGEKNKYDQRAFIDGEEKKKYSRICTEDQPEFGKCPWCEVGYQKRRVFAVNVIDREDGKLKILNKGITVFKEFSEQESANEITNADTLKDNPDASEEEMEWTIAGGPRSADVRIIARYADDVLGNVKYSVKFLTKQNSVTEDEIEMIKSVGEPSPEEKRAIYDANPELKELPEWFICGFPLEKIFSPDTLAPKTKSTRTADLSLDADDDDATPAEDEKPARAAKTTRRSAAPAATEDDEPKNLSHPMADDDAKGDGDEDDIPSW